MKSSKLFVVCALAFLAVGGAARAESFAASAVENASQPAPAIPASATWAMMLLGIAGLGFSGSRRKAADHAA